MIEADRKKQCSEKPRQKHRQHSTADSVSSRTRVSRPTDQKKAPKTTFSSAKNVRNAILANSDAPTDVVSPK